MSKNCNNKMTDCLGNTVQQLGVNNTTTPGLSELAFNTRYSAGKTATGGGYYVGVENNKVGGLPEIVPYFDCNKPTYSPKNASQPVKPGFNKVQKAGAIIYQYITNPLTGRKVNINGKIGRKVIMGYLQQTGGMRSYDTAFTGQESVFDPNMNNRDFGCRQPQWDPKCV